MNNNEINGNVNNPVPPTEIPVMEPTPVVPEVPAEQVPVQEPAPVEPAPVVPEVPVAETIPVVEPVVPETPAAVQPAVPEVPAVEPTPLPDPVPVEPTPVVDKDPRSVGIDNTEFIHPQAFEMAKPPEQGAIVNEKLKKVEVEYKPASKYKIALVVVLFIFLIAFVLFLPEISTVVEQKLSGNGYVEEEKITDGRLTCILNSNTTNLDKKHAFVFKFSNNKLDKLEYTVTTKGDPSLDEEALNKLATNCKLLSQVTEPLDGVTVRCTHTTGKLEEVQSFDLINVDMTAVRSAYEEAGGINPEYPYGQDMDVIERSMNASGYDCKRES